MVVIRRLEPLVKIKMPEREKAPVKRQFLVVVRRRKDHPSPTPQDTPCVLWQGAVDKDGYGRRWVYLASGKRDKRGMHRWALEQSLGRELRKHEFVMHACDQPLCYRVSHLSVGTIQDNNADMIRKRRNTPPPVNRLVGLRNPNAKLSPKEKEDMKKAYQDGFSPATLAEHYKVHVSTVRKILKGTPKVAPPPSIYEIIEKEKRNG